MKKLLALVAAFVVAPFAAAEDKTIVEIAAGNKDFSTLVTAVKAAGLVDTLSGGEFTVFAPTNEAFDALKKKIGDEAFAAVLKDRAKLTAILTAHAVKGTVMAKDAVALDGKEAETVQGTKFKVTVADGKVKIGDATVVKADIKAKNGVIHVIDTVLMPAAK
jgi:uncharacterized surface protein with fasciclin (FAS1) repeats